MPGTAGLAVLLIAAALLVGSLADRPIAGLSPEEFAAVTALLGLALLAAGWIIHEFRGRWMHGVSALLSWVAIALALVGFYSYRYELQEVATRLLGEISPGRPVVSPTGEVTVARRADGSFTVAGRVNDRDLRFIFDTGASTVVLTAEAAQLLRLQPATGDYSVPVLTANGRTMTAPVSLAQLAIGPIVERNVRALVARPGVLHENLLGMTFLERLTSYEVRSNRLILRGRTS
jgi:aspartyl protease family protein